MQLPGDCVEAKAQGIKDFFQRCSRVRTTQDCGKRRLCDPNTLVQQRWDPLDLLDLLNLLR